MLWFLFGSAGAQACDPLNAALPGKLAGLARAAPRCKEGVACVSYERGDSFVTVAVETVMPGSGDVMHRDDAVETFSVGAVPVSLTSVALGAGSFGSAATAVVDRRVITVVASGPDRDLAKVAMSSLDLVGVASAFAPCSSAVDRALDALVLLPATLDGMDRMDLRNAKLPPDPPVVAAAAFGGRAPLRTGTIVMSEGPVPAELRPLLSIGDRGPAPDHGGLVVGPGVGGWLAQAPSSVAAVEVTGRFFVLVTIDAASTPDAAARVMRALDLAAMDRVVSGMK